MSELEVRDYSSGEIVDVQNAETDRLAEFCRNLKAHREMLSQAERLVHDELLSRMDRDGRWTVRVRNGDRQIELKAPSPAAGGGSAILDDVLIPGVRRLVADGVISREAADNAVRRQVTLTVTVGIDADLDGQAEGLRAITDADEVRTSEVTVKAGINALAKMGGDAAGLVREATLEQSPGPRRVSVKVASR